MNTVEYFEQFDKRMKKYDEIAKLCGVKPVTVRMWAKGKFRPGVENAKKLEKATKGALKRYDIMFG